MKPIIKLTTVLLFCILTISVSGQNVKVGHINASELLQIMPGINEAKQKLEEYAKQLENQVKSMMAEYQGKVSDYESKQELMADAVKEVKIKEISDLQARIQSFQQTAQENLLSKEKEMTEPIILKAKEAIKNVAKEKDYAYILDTSEGGSVLFAHNSDDIMPFVKVKLGIK